VERGSLRLTSRFAPYCNSDWRSSKAEASAKFVLEVANVTEVDEPRIVHKEYEGRRPYSGLRCVIDAKCFPPRCGDMALLYLFDKVVQLCGRNSFFPFGLDGQYFIKDTVYSLSGDRRDI